MSVRVADDAGTSTPGRPSLVPHLIGVTIAGGALLRILQVAADTTQYLGEIRLARDTDSRSIGRLLTEPLSFGTASSYGYLLAQKFFVGVLGTGDLAHRVFPLVASLAGLWVFLALARQYLQGPALLFAVACFSFGVPFIIIVAPFKPHGTVDTAATLGLLLVALHLVRQPLGARAAMRAGLIGFVLLWFAEAATLVAAGVIVALIVSALLQRAPQRLKSMLPAFTLWAIGGVATVVASYAASDATMRARCGTCTPMELCRHFPT